MKKISKRKTRQTWEPTVSDQLWHRLIQLGEYITLWAERERVQPSAMQNMEYLHAHDTNRNMTISLRHVHQKYTCANMRAAQIMVHDTTHSKQYQATIGTWNRQTNLFAIRQELSQAGNEAYGAYLTHSMLHSGPASIPSMCSTSLVPRPRTRTREKGVWGQCYMLPDLRGAWPRWRNQ